MMITDKGCIALAKTLGHNPNITSVKLRGRGQMGLVRWFCRRPLLLLSKSVCKLHVVSLVSTSVRRKDNTMFELTCQVFGDHNLVRYSSQFVY